jgi:hypothetical protein
MHKKIQFSVFSNQASVRIAVYCTKPNGRLCESLSINLRQAPRSEHAAKSKYFGTTFVNQNFIHD